MTLKFIDNLDLDVSMPIPIKAFDNKGILELTDLNGFDFCTCKYSFLYQVHSWTRTPNTTRTQHFVTSAH